MTYSMPLEVYLQSAVVRGLLSTNQDRLSSYFVLPRAEEVFSITAATLADSDGKPLGAPSGEYLIYMQEVFCIADLSPHGGTRRTGQEPFFVKKEASKALLNFGPYSLRGNVHLVPGAPLHELIMAKTPFLPVTDAVLLNRREQPPRTYLVNRSKIGCMTALSDGLVEL